MPSSDSLDAPPEVVRVAPQSQLSRGGLIAALVLMIAIGLSVYAMFPESIGGPPLPVGVSVGEAPVETTNGSMAVLTKVLTVTSELDQPIGNLGIEVNDNYLYHQASPLQPGETLVLPQEVFTDKRSSRRFDPSRQQISEVIVRGQLPSKARGVSKFEFEH